MTDSSERPWSNDPYAPQLTYRLYFAEETNLWGTLIGAILYGAVIVLFFRCMAALLNPINRTRGGIKWGLVIHTVVMFSFVTVYTATTLDFQSISYIDNRKFPGADGTSPGPLGYQLYSLFEPIGFVQMVMFALNGWLADGLLLYRCYVTYAMNYWAIIFPCLMYLSSVAMGIGFIYQGTLQAALDSSSVSFGVPYYSISLALNILLTLMIVARLVLHSKNVRSAMGPSATTAGLYKVIVSMLIESCALYAVSYLLFLVPFAFQNPITNAFFSILAQAQVIAPFLIILRVANQRALPNGTASATNISSIHFYSKGRSTGSGGTLPDGDSVGTTVVNGKSPDELGVGVMTSDFHREKA